MSLKLKYFGRVKGHTDLERTVMTGMAPVRRGREGQMWTECECWSRSFALV